MTALYIELFDSEFRYCLLATGTNAHRDGPERTVARVEFKGDREQRKADFEALRRALETPDAFEAMGLDPVAMPALKIR